MKVLVTGSAGFVGFHLSRKLLSQGHTVVGLDNVNDYYSPQLKRDRLALLAESSQFSFEEASLEDREAMADIFARHRAPAVVNLAAQAGVRYSIENPHIYIDSNLVGFTNVLEGCRHNGCEHLVFASSSSVYGANTAMPFSVRHNVDHPLSLYAATKKANELMAHTYANLYNLPTTGLRFFTVYGPWGRPDMALFLFAKAILNDQPIDVFNNGHMQRDFTYVDDIVEGIYRLLTHKAAPDTAWTGQAPTPHTSFAPYRIYNIGNNKPEPLMKYIELLEKTLGKKAEKNFLPLQDGDVPATWSDTQELFEAVGFQPKVTIEQGVPKFVEWYRDYYNI